MSTASTGNGPEAARAAIRGPVVAVEETLRLLPVDDQRHELVGGNQLTALRALLEPPEPHGSARR